MSLEFPTLKIALPIQEILLLLRQVVQNKGGILESDGSKISIKKEYLFILDHTATEEKLNRMASRRLRSREYLFFFFSLFFLAIFSELFILKVFFGNESEKTIPYFQADSSKKETGEMLLTRNISTTPTNTRGLQPWVAILLIAATGGSFFALYQSRRGREEKIAKLRKELVQELNRKGLDIKLEKRAELFHLDLVDNKQSTEIIFLTENGSPLITHFIATLVTASQKYNIENSSSFLITGNWPLQQLLQKFKNQKVMDWQIDPQALNLISFSSEAKEDIGYNFS
jgi:hypothetical protein